MRLLLNKCTVMFATKIQESLQESISALPVMLCAPSLRHDVDELLRPQFAGGSFAVVDDVYTRDAFGAQAFGALAGIKGSAHITLDKGVEATDEAVAEVRRKSASCDVLVAVGSGTVSDICKYAAAQEGKPYVVFPTAASMNGYTSANASITLKGHKTSLAAQLPEAIYCDMGVICAAPPRLHKSGLGDSVARATAQTDWLLSHLLLGTPYEPLVFSWVAELEEELFANARGLALADPASIEQLIKLLLLSGLGMTHAKGSYPASQAEHMIAHSYHMLKGSPLPATLHGEEIGVTTLLCAKLQERLMNGAPILCEAVFGAAAMQDAFGEALLPSFEEAYAPKQLRLTSELAEKLYANWPFIAAQLQAVSLPEAKIRQVLTQAEALVEAGALGWEDARLNQAATLARFTRDRFTCLDLRLL